MRERTKKKFNRFKRNTKYFLKTPIKTEENTNPFVNSNNKENQPQNCNTDNLLDSKNIFLSQSKIIQNPTLRNYYNEILTKNIFEKIKLIKNEQLKEDNQLNDYQINELSNINNLEKTLYQKGIDINDILLKEFAEEKGLEINYIEITKKKHSENITQERKNIINKMEDIADKLLNENKSLDYKESINFINQFGKLTKKELEDDLKTNPENYIDFSRIKDGDDNETIILKKIASSFKNLGSLCAIEKKTSNEKVLDATLQMIMSGMANQTKNEMHFDCGIVENTEILTNPRKRHKFEEKIKNTISENFLIPKDEIFLLNFRQGSVCFDLFLKRKIQITNDINEIKKILPNITEIHEKPLLDAIILSKEIFDPEGNNCGNGWEKKNFFRGGEKYDPPYEWIGFGLRVKDKYDGGNNDWIGCEGEDNEWAVAYHGVGNRGGINLNIEGKAINIIQKGLQAGIGQRYKDEEDIRHYGKTVGTGVYLTPIIKEAERYAESGIGDDLNAKIVFMCRVNPNKIREPKRGDDESPYWVLNGTPDEIRPYRILLKE